jgi:hypothetical protein
MMSLFGDAAPAGEPELTIVRATFQGSDELTFSDLITGYTRLRVLTYSNSLPMLEIMQRKLVSLPSDRTLYDMDRTGLQSGAWKSIELYCRADCVENENQGSIVTSEPLGWWNN